jgi:hypothetical protein
LQWLQRLEVPDTWQSRLRSKQYEHLGIGRPSAEEVSARRRRRWVLEEVRFFFRTRSAMMGKGSRDCKRERTPTAWDKGCWRYFWTWEGSQVVGTSTSERGHRVTNKPTRWPQVGRPRAAQGAPGPIIQKQGQANQEGALGALYRATRATGRQPIGTHEGGSVSNTES